MLNHLYNTIIIVICIFILGWFIELVHNTVSNMLVKLFGSRIARFIVNNLTFIGVIHHELSHALFATITGAKVTKINMFKPDRKTGTLGSISMYTRGGIVLSNIQLTLSAIAPMITGLISSYILIKIVTANQLSFYTNCIIYYVLFSIIVHMRLSKIDIKNAVKGLPLCMIAIFCIVTLLNIDILSILNM